jgi:acyl-CoA thioesterase
MTMTPQQTAEFVRDGMFTRDLAAQALGIEIGSVAPGRAAAVMTVRRDMLNGFGICHGGLIATLADTAFAFACNSYNEMTVASGLRRRPAGRVAPGRRAHRHRHRGAPRPGAPACTTSLSPTSAASASRCSAAAVHA